MQPKKYAILATLGVKTLGLALASSCLIYTAANAAGLGKMTVLSALGQPLKAEIELTSVTKEDASNIVPKLASAEAFRQANIEYSSNLMSLRFAVEERGSRHYVLVTSTQSINEPFVEILLELNSSSGKLTREYTMLIDPIEMQANNAATSSGKDVAVASKPIIIQTPIQPAVAAPVATPSTVAAQRPTERTAAAPTKMITPAANSGTEYQIKRGDTLGKIADQLKPVGVSLDQMLVALHKSNPDAFINDNMNLLRSGHILTVPSAPEIERTSKSEAQKIVLAQSVDFNSYRNKLANQVAQAAPEKALAPKKQDSGKITAKVVETPTTASESKDKLKLSKAQLQDQADKKALEEDKIAKQKALDAANARVKELELNTAKLQGILDLKNKASASAAAKPAAVASAPVAIAAPVATPVASASAAASLASKPVKPKVVAVAAPTAAAPGMFDNLLGGYLPYAVGLLALLGIAGIYSSKRKKKTEHFDDESILTGSSMKANSLFGSTGGQSVDTNNSVFNSNFAPSASQLDANEVDPVAEADVYIAYGRDEQAEEILKEALRTHPERQAVRVKLLEIYAHRKDTRSFETVASELYGMTGGDGGDWAQAATMGMMIDPQNPLYAGGGNSENYPAVLGASTLPIESLDPEALLGNSLSQQMLDSISSKHDENPSSILGDLNDNTHRTVTLEDDLDFDLGLTSSPDSAHDDEFTSSFSSQAAVVAVPAAVSAPKAEPLPVPVAEPEAIQHPAGKEDFEFEFANVAQPQQQPEAKPLPSESAAVEDNEASMTNASNTLDFAALDFDFDIPLSKPDTELHKPLVAEPALDDEEEHSFMPAPEVRTDAASVFDFDLSGIDLELPPATPADHGEPNFKQASSDDFKFDSDIPLTALDHADLEHESELMSEMTTKLDLAVAYQEIGDKDGARELLDEVLKGGNAEQISRAKTMLHELT